MFLGLLIGLLGAALWADPALLGGVESQPIRVLRHILVAAWLVTTALVLWPAKNQPINSLFLYFMILAWAAVGLLTSVGQFSILVPIGLLLLLGKRPKSKEFAGPIVIFAISLGAAVATFAGAFVLTSFTIQTWDIVEYRPNLVIAVILWVICIALSVVSWLKYPAFDKEIRK